MALGSGNWSIAGATATGTTGKIHENTYIEGRERVVNLKLTMAASGWPGAGVPMPQPGSIGFHRNINAYDMPTKVYSSGTLHATRTLVFSLSSTGNKLMRCYRSQTMSGSGQSIVAATQTLTAAAVFYVTARGW